MSSDIEQTARAPVPLDDEFPSIAAPGVRRRLFAVLGWAGAGFVAITALAFVLAAAFQDLLRDVGVLVAALCVGAGLGGFVTVVKIAQGLDEDDRGRAQWLLWSTVLVCAALITVFGAALNVSGDAQLGIAFAVEVALAVAGAGAAVLAILAIAIAVGFEDPLMLFVRWALFIALVAVPVYVVDPELWWVGLIGGFALAVAVEATLNEALKRWYVPEPALGACLVAGVTAVVLLVIYIVVRFVVRLTLAVVAGAAEGAANS